MATAKHSQRVRLSRAPVGMTGARGGNSGSGRRDHPPRSAGTPPPKPTRPIAAAAPANIVHPVEPKLRDPEFATGFGSGLGQAGAGQESQAAQGRGVGVSVAGEIDILIGGRERSHGDYRVQAAKAQQLKRAYRDSPNWSALTDGQKQALEENANKVARILCGDADHSDHWRDIAGYAVLGERCPITGSWRT